MLLHGLDGLEGAQSRKRTDTWLDRPVLGSASAEAAAHYPELRPRRPPPCETKAYMIKKNIESIHQGAEMSR